MLRLITAVALAVLSVALAGVAVHLEPDVVDLARAVEASTDAGNLRVEVQAERRAGRDTVWAAYGTGAEALIGRDRLAYDLQLVEDGEIRGEVVVRGDGTSIWVRSASLDALVADDVWVHTSALTETSLLRRHVADLPVHTRGLFNAVATLGDEFIPALDELVLPIGDGVVAAPPPPDSRWVAAFEPDAWFAALSTVRGERLFTISDLLDDPQVLVRVTIDADGRIARVEETLVGEAEGRTYVWSTTVTVLDQGREIDATVPVDAPTIDATSINGL